MMACSERSTSSKEPTTNRASRNRRKPASSDRGAASGPLRGAPRTRARGPAAVLHPGRDARIRAGHRWVYRNEIARLDGPALDGDAVEVHAAGGRTLGIGLLNTRSAIAIRLLASPGELVDEAFFRERLARAIAVRRRVVGDTTAYRLCFGESDGLPGLVVDRYGDVLVLQVLSAGMEARLSEIGAALDELLKPRAIYLKNDHRARQLEGLPLETRLLAGQLPDKAQISEGGLRFATPLGGGQKTGFYFDQAENRAFLRP